MATVPADRTSRPTAPRPDARRVLARAKDARVAVAPARPDTATRAVAADVMSVLAAFGMRD